ncbi:hypothetical protein L2719_16095 [Shewanella schlegeliana]|uniref:Uncharacterized protein n=1 Tax=Shewanella schlegeliana TaxID=190308 RepID=A0ABS1T4J6_9GAMM|nr:hypothetical protein [Shewanella schlegeliana]MBL4915079.1 hypothetical protein [Shewanella schlegeliana]MCL1111055.1 hypothetical protein [Shewanella schlegeliana]GIU38394.1 hypothetical protein TUM4433_39970 [Shewanella schlegeliana]
MEPDKLTSQEPLGEPDLQAMLSELNRKRLKSFAVVIAVVAGLAVGFYGARWLYQWLFAVS